LPAVGSLCGFVLALILATTGDISGMIFPAFARQRGCDNVGPRTDTWGGWGRRSLSQLAGTNRRTRRKLRLATTRTKALAVAGLVAGETTHLIPALGGTVVGVKASGTLPLGLANEAEEAGLLLAEAARGVVAMI
jgi:hypothetical protein